MVANQTAILGDAAGAGSSLNFSATGQNAPWSAIMLPVLPLQVVSVPIGLGGGGTLSASRIAPVQYDNSAGNSQQNNSSGGSFPITVNGNCILFWGWIGSNNYAWTAWNNSIGGVTIPLLKTMAWGTGTLGLFGLMNPAQGAQSISTPFPAGTAGGIGIAFAAETYRNVSSIGTAVTNSGTGTAATHTVTSGAAYQMIAQAFACDGSSSLSAYNQSARYHGTAQPASSIQQGDAPGAASVAFSATLSASAGWASIAVPLNYS
jgi:hypothetical protein